MEHNARFDNFMKGVLVRNGLTEMGAYAIVAEQVLTEVADRRRVYELLREFLAPGPIRPPVSNPRRGW